MTAGAIPEAIVCRVCGCSDGRLPPPALLALVGCTWFEVLGDGSSRRMGCWWVADGLCSECAPAPDEELPAPLLYDAGGRPLVFR